MSKERCGGITAADPAPQTAQQPDAADHSAREQVISDYFAMWLARDGRRLEEIFAADTMYVESTGNAYRGISQIVRWFADWFENGEVRRWDIKCFSHSGSKTFVEWYFECVCYGNLSGFDGVSIVEFDDSGRICSLREFAAEYQHTMPYGD